MDGPGPRQSRRTRSQRDRERLRRRAESQRRASSASSDSERPAVAEDGTGTTVRLDSGAEPLCGRRRPPRRRKRESASREEDIIDGFAIASFVSLEALETDCPLNAPEHVAFLRDRGTKRRRIAGDSEDHLDRESDRHGYPAGYQERRRKRGRKPETAGSFLLETGYICDAESDSGDKMSENDMDPIFTVSTRKEPAPLTMATSVRSGPSPPSTLRCHPWLSVTPRVSGLQRSQEKSVDLSASEPLATAAASLSLPKGVPPRPGVGPSPKLKAFLVLPEHRTAPSGLDFSRSSTVAKPPSSSASSSSVCTPTPTASVAASLSGALPSRAHSSSGTHYRSSPGLPPPPPLQQGGSQPPTGSGAGALTGSGLLSQELRPHFLASKCTGPEGGAPTADTQTNGGPSSSGPSEASGRRSAPTSAQTAVPPLAFQFHQHNHQHQHTHTHQHFTPFLPPPTAASPLFDKCKMEGLYRHPFFPQYPPTVPGIPPVLPSTGQLSNLRGAFQPKGTSPEMSPRLGPVAHLQPKEPKLSDPFKMSSRVSNKPGKWCAMHVRVAWMIFRHQEKVKADPRKLDFRSDMLARLPGSGHGPLGAVHPSSSSFVPPLTPHSSFLTPPGHFDAFGRLLPYASLGSLGTGAFGGLGSTALVPSSFGPKDSPGRPVGGVAGCHDSWKRLHRASAFSTAPAWTPAADKREEREPAKEKKEVIHIKDEKDRDCLAYGRRPGLESPAMAPVRPRGSTPVSQRDREGPQPDTEAPPREGPPTAHSRDRERDSKPTPSLSSRLHLAPERPCSSSSSAPPTPAPPLSLAPSPLDLYPCRHTPQATKSQAEASRPPQKESFPPCAPTSLLSQDKKADPRPSPNRPSPHLLPPIKVKEERRDEPEPGGLSLLPAHSGAPAPLCLGPAPGLPPHHALSLSLTPRAAGMVVASPAERYAPYPHVLPQSHWMDPWREQQREALALRPDATLARLFQQHQAQRLYEAERVANPHHPPGSAPLPPPSSVRQDFGLPHHAHPEHGPQSMGGTGGGLLDTEQRAHILREDFERARYGMHPHTLLATPHLATPSHHHLEPLYGSLLSHPHQPGAAGPHHHTSLYSRLGHLASHPRHVANGLISKATSGLMGSLSIGAPPPLIPSVTPSRASVSPRSSRFAPPPELVLYSTHKDRESR